MIKSVRAAGFAAFAFAAALLLGGGEQLQAQGEAAAPTVHYLAHASAALDAGELALNGELSRAEASVLQAFSSPAALHERAIAAVPVPVPPLDVLVDEHRETRTANAEEDCLANAVYFEARGEPIEGQLAVAEVVLNRMRSDRYPGTICAVVTQPAQFSFVRRGVIPRADRASEAWRRAVACARIAQAEAQRLLPRNVLWYHANYVSPGWGRRLERNTQIGLHIFYS